MPPVGGGQISARPGWGWQQEGLYGERSPCPSLWLSFFSCQREGKGVLCGEVPLRLVTTSLWRHGLAQHMSLPGVSRKGLCSQHGISFKCKSSSLGSAPKDRKGSSEAERKLRSLFRSSFHLGKGPCPTNDQNLPPHLCGQAGEGGFVVQI